MRKKNAKMSEIVTKVGPLEADHTLILVAGLIVAKRKMRVFKLKIKKLTIAP
jgi:hypothetical protein